MDDIKSDVCKIVEDINAHPERYAACDDYSDRVAAKCGTWLRTEAYPHHVYCSQCYHSLVSNAEIIEQYNIPTKYCPHCGARMEQEV